MLSLKKPTFMFSTLPSVHSADSAVIGREVIKLLFIPGDLPQGHCCPGDTTFSLSPLSRDFNKHQKSENIEQYIVKE